MKFSFEVGNKEKHKIDFYWDWFWGNLNISVDTKPVITKWVTPFSHLSLNSHPETPSQDKWRIGIWGKINLDIDLVRRWSFTVGNEEKHQVRIEKERTKLFAGGKPQKFRVFIDDCPFMEKEGF